MNEQDRSLRKRTKQCGGKQSAGGIEEGNGNALQGSCLENPRDGVAQIGTRLSLLSSSSSGYDYTVGVVMLVA